MVYIIKSLVPWEMSALYPYPHKISAVFYISIIPALAVVAVTIFKFK
jgi:hypothetical protein